MLLFYTAERHQTLKKKVAFMFEELLPNSKFKEHQLSVFFPVGNLQI